MDFSKFFPEGEYVTSLTVLFASVVFIGLLATFSGGLLLLVSYQFISLLLQGMAVSCVGVLLWAGTLYYNHRLEKRAA